MARQRQLAQRFVDLQRIQQYRQILQHLGPVPVVGDFQLRQSAIPRSQNPRQGRNSGRAARAVLQHQLSQGRRRHGVTELVLLLLLQRLEDGAEVAFVLLFVALLHEFGTRPNEFERLDGHILLQSVGQCRGGRFRDARNRQAEILQRLARSDALSQRSRRGLRQWRLDGQLLERRIVRLVRQPAPQRREVDFVITQHGELLDLVIIAAAPVRGRRRRRQQQLDKLVDHPGAMGNMDAHGEALVLQRPADGLDDDVIDLDGGNVQLREGGVPAELGQPIHDGVAVAVAREEQHLAEHEVQLIDGLIDAML
mmetsp:Transcript_11521/g.33102  ORF Transcript_11521/g.33102 Transcript_11521/m.33102 type:complete len:310 (+) Transcript_11521:1200-2129(+)